MLNLEMPLLLFLIFYYFCHRFFLVQWLLFFFCQWLNGLCIVVSTEELPLLFSCFGLCSIFLGLFILFKHEMHYYSVGAVKAM